jgi:hypothetical protein
LSIYPQGVLHLILGLGGLQRVFQQTRCRENRKPSKGNLISERFFVKKLPLSDVLKTHFLSPFEHFKTLLVGCIDQNLSDRDDYFCFIANTSVV